MGENTDNPTNVMMDGTHKCRKLLTNAGKQEANPDLHLQSLHLAPCCIAVKHGKLTPVTKQHPTAHLRCLRHIPGVTWNHKIPQTRVLPALKTYFHNATRAGLAM